MEIQKEEVIMPKRISLTILSKVPFGYNIYDHNHPLVYINLITPILQFHFF